MQKDLNPPQKKKWGVHGMTITLSGGEYPVLELWLG